MAYDGPRFRRDLISTVFYEGGVRCVDVHDPKRGATFRLFDYEYSVALAFDGRDLGKVISWVRVSTGLELNEEQLTSFARRLDQLGFLEKPKAEGEVTPPPAVPSETPDPLPVRVAPAPPPPRDENAPPPEAGSLATATRSVSGERLVSTGAPAEPEAPVAVDTPEPGPLAAPQDDEEKTAVEDVRPVPEQDAVPEEIPAEPAELSQPVAPKPDETTEPFAPSPAEAPRPVAPKADEAPEPLALGRDEDAGAPRPAAPESEEPEAPKSPSQEPETPSADAASPASTAAVADAASAAEPAPETECTREAPEKTEAPAEASAPSGSSPELPVAVGPSPERTREAPSQRSARLPSQATPRPAGPASRRQVTPPPIPRDRLTGASAPATGLRRIPWKLSALFGVLAALVVGTVVAPFALGTRPPAPISVCVNRVTPSEVVRWLDVTAPIESTVQTLSLPIGGKVLRIASPGLELRAGDVVAATDAARSLLADWGRAQEQLAFAQQLLEGLRDSADEKKIASAQATVMQRAAQLDRMRAAVAKVAIVAKEPSTVAETMVSLGQTVQAGGAAVRLRLPGWRARFELNRLPARFRQQGLCLAEISGRQVPCSFVPEEGNDIYLVVSLPADAVTSPGLLTHLARSRTLNATLVPASALSDSNGKPRVLVVAPNGRTEMRSVVLADRSADTAVVTQGLDPGDAVVIESARPVGAGTPVRIVESLDE